MFSLSDEGVYFERRYCSTSAARGVQLGRYIQIGGAFLPSVSIFAPATYQVNFACGKNNFSFVFTVFRRYFRGGANTMGSFLSHLSSVPYIGNLCVRKDMVVYETCRMMCAKKCLCESE